MKNISLVSSIFFTAVILSFSACKKSDNTDYSMEYTTQTDDQLLISAEIDGVAIDANAAVEATPSFFNKNANSPSICDGTVVADFTGSIKKLTITYKGTNCAGTNYREGVVVISKDNDSKWSDVGAVMTVKYENLRITRKKDQKTITLNGIVTITNVSGGRLDSNIVVKPLVHTLNSTNMTVTFDDGSVKSWSIAVKREYSFDRGLVISTTGTHNTANYKNISAWGVTRQGRAFTSIIEEPMIIREDCNFRLVSARLIQIQSQVLTIKFGLDENGVQTSCPGIGKYYLNVSWTNQRNRTQSILLPY